MSEVLEAGSELTRAKHAQDMAAYGQEGLRRAREIGNRGPVRFDADGRPASRHPGGVLEARLLHLRGRRRAGRKSRSCAATPPRCWRGRRSARAPKVDAHGRDRRSASMPPRELYTLIKPLSDPQGGTGDLRRPASEQDGRADAGWRRARGTSSCACAAMCQYMPAGLRVYGHPQLLAIAAAINGDDFVPFNDVIFVKQPGLGGSVAWHQDGVTHWDNPEWDEGIHGFNYQVQLYPTTAGNALWVVPGTHKQGRVDIKRLVAENGGSEQLPGAIPLICAAGDVTIVNRQTLHGSFANTSPDLRISITFGFHRRTSVLGAKTALSMKVEGVCYDEQRIAERAAVIAVAIDARRQRYPDEQPFRYQPFAGREDEFRLNDATFDRVIRDYNLKDLAI